MALKLYHVFIWRKLIESRVEHQVWLQNYTDDRMVCLFRGDKDEAKDYAKHISWAVNGGPIRVRDEVRHWGYRERLRRLSRERRLPSKAAHRRP